MWLEWGEGPIQGRTCVRTFVSFLEQPCIASQPEFCPEISLSEPIRWVLGSDVARDEVYSTGFVLVFVKRGVLLVLRQCLSSALPVPYSVPYPVPYLAVYGGSHFHVLKKRKTILFSLFSKRGNANPHRQRGKALGKALSKALVRHWKGTGKALVRHPG